ncbi:MAG: hypothetical protein JWP85_2665 [Rhodoglobus sp.]|nr:hypothetical protein [Rhodoglobus sp.]
MTSIREQSERLHAAGGGIVRDTVSESLPAWNLRDRPARNAPNIVVVVLDDMGWSDLGCFGSEINTPVIDALAANGLRMTNFQVTPLCSPTRASLLTGMNHHTVGMRFLSVTDTGFPNSRGQLPKGIATVPGTLRAHGYGTYLAGKWHLAPRGELTPAGPYDNWPLARGFDRFFGFLGGASDQYIPELIQDNSPVTPSNDGDYHLSSDLVERSIGYLRDHAAFRPADPFYLQLAFGATHAPFQAPKEYVDRYRGVFDAGWDQARSDRFNRQKLLGVIPKDSALTERDGSVPEWSELSDIERAIATRTQEAFAGFLEHTDAQLGRLVDWLREAELTENTLIAVLSDNGAAGDGGAFGTSNVVRTYNGLPSDPTSEAVGLDAYGDRDHPVHYGSGWAMAGNTPFRLYKQYVDLGGVRSPLVIHWPRAISDPGATRDQYLHVVDLAASLLDSAIDPDSGSESVAGSLDGKSFLPVLSSGSADSPRSTQYFEMLGHRAIWHSGWKATTRHAAGTPYSDDIWRLYDTTRDFSENNDLADAHPQRLQELVDLWWHEARAAGALPLDDRSLHELLGGGGAGASRHLDSIRLRPGQSHLSVATRLTGTDRTMTVVARLHRSEGNEQGVILASGASYGGYVLFILDGRLSLEHHFLGDRVRCVSDRPVPGGESVVGFELVRSAGRSADVTLLIDGAAAGRVRVPNTSIQLAFYGLDTGRDPGSRVSTTYGDRGEFAFSPDALRDVTITFAADNSPADLARHIELDQ